MRKLFLVIASIFTVLGIVFSFLPLGTIAFLPIAIALLFGFLAFQKSDESQKKLVKVLLIFSVIALIWVASKEILIKDKVEKDAAFEKVKTQSKEEDKKELENLEKDLE